MLGSLEEQVAMDRGLKLVIMMAATSSKGSWRSPSSVRQMSCPLRHVNEQCGESMLTMWNDTADGGHDEVVL